MDQKTRLKLIFSVVAVLLVVGAFAFSQGYFSKTKAVTIPTVWKTYTNPTYGYQIEYPADWATAEYLKSDQPTWGVTHVAFDPSRVATQREFDSADTRLGRMVIFVEPTVNQKLKYEQRKIGPDPLTVGYFKLVLGSQADDPWKNITDNEYHMTLPPEYQKPAFKGLVIAISYPNSEDSNSTQQEIFNHMLSTFRFVKLTK